MAARGSEWISLKRSLIILRRLIIGPASGQDLVQAVIDLLGAEAYPTTEKARRAAFKHDRDNLRKNLEVDFAYDPRLGTYTLQNRGPFATLELSPEHQRTLAMLYQVVMKRGDEFHQVRDLVSELVGRLSADAQNKAITFASGIDIKLEQFVGEGTVDNKVWSTIARSIQEKRKLAFQYLPPQAFDQGFWYVEVAPIKIQFRIGNWYLQAYELLRRDPNNRVELDAGYQRYPMTRIQSDDKLAVLPNMMASSLRKPPSLQVFYRLSPSASSEAIRPYFDKMKTTRQPDGSYEITAVTDDIQEAARLLAGYGEDCTVLGGPELRSIFEEMVRKMAGNYGMNA